MNIRRMHFALTLQAFCAALVLPQAALSQNYPDVPVCSANEAAHSVQLPTCDAIRNDAREAFEFALRRVEEQGGGAVRIPTGTYRFRQLRSDGTLRNPTMIVSSNTTIASDPGVLMLSEVGPGGDYGYNTCLFVNKAAVIGDPWKTQDKDIKIKGGAFQVASAPAIATVRKSAAAHNDKLVLDVSSGALVRGMGFSLSYPKAENPKESELASISVNEYDPATSTAFLAKKLPRAIEAGETFPIGWTGGPFFCMINVTGFELGGTQPNDHVHLLDVEGGRSTVAPWYGFRTILAVSNFEVRGVRIGYALSDTTKHLAKHYGSEDGLHFYGPTEKGTIADVKGVSGDDFIALDLHAKLSGQQIPQSAYYIRDVNIEDVVATSRWAQALRMIVSHDQSNSGQFSNIRIRRFFGISDSLGGNDCSGGVFIGGEHNLRTAPRFVDIDMRDVTLDCRKAGGHCLRIDGGSGVLFSGLRFIVSAS